MTESSSQAIAGVDVFTPGVRLARSAVVLGTGYAVLSAYWGLGGTWLLDTVGGGFGAAGASAAVYVAVWSAVLLKLIAAVLPIMVVRGRTRPARNRLTRSAAWTEAAILTLYGLVLTVVGLLVQAGAIPAAPHADHRALSWHTYLWDPWFLLWGLLVLAALCRDRRERLVAGTFSRQEVLDAE